MNNTVLRQSARSSPAMHYLAAAVLMAGGIRLAMVCESGIGQYSWLAKLILLTPLLALIPAVSRPMVAGLRHLGHLSRRRRLTTALVLAIVSMGYLYFSAVQQGLRFVPLVKDEYSYLLQARMLAQGRLWMPPHPLGEFFDATLILTDRVYASAYFPGTALLLVWGILLDLPAWVMPMLVSGASLVLLYLILSKLMSDLAAMAGVLLLVATGIFQAMWRFAMAQIPMMLAGMLLVWLLLHWRRRLDWRWAFALGLAGGWALLIRPIDAVCYGLPVAAAMLLLARQRPVPLMRSAVAGLLGLLPFVVLQLICNVGITGRWTQFPYAYYNQRDLPGVSYGFPRFDVALRSASPSPQKQAELASEHLTLRNHRPVKLIGDLERRRLPILLSSALPHPYLAVFMPLGLLGLHRRRRWVLAATAPLFVLLYLPWASVLAHYPVVVAPGMLLLTLLGMQAVQGIGGRFRPTVAAFLALLVLAAFVTSLPQVNPVKSAADPAAVVPADIDQMVRRVTDAPAVVLHRWDDANGRKMRVVNIDVAWPDAAPIIKALDLGPRNQEIFCYYAESQPGREFFLYDFADGSLNHLGTTRQLAGRPR